MVTDVEYRRAVAEPAFRQDFLGMVDFGPMRRYVRKVLYEPDEMESVRLGLAEMVIVPSLPARFHIRGTRSKIIAYPLAFYNCHNLRYFLSSLIDHEGYHAKDYYECPERIAWPIDIFFTHWFFSRILSNEKYDGWSVPIKVRKAAAEIRRIKHELNKAKQNGGLDTNQRRHLEFDLRKYGSYLLENSNGDFPEEQALRSELFSELMII